MTANLTHSSAMLASPSTPLDSVTQSDKVKNWHPKIEPEDRLIFALDVPDHQEALRYIDLLGDSVTFYKVGWELFMSGDYFQLIDELGRRKKKVLADLKVVDIPETVGRAVNNLKGRHGMFLTFFAQYPSVLSKAVEFKNGIKIIAVTTALTSKDENDLIDWLEMSEERQISDLILLQAQRASDVGVDGFICSALEVPKLRERFGDKLLVFSPGIRPEGIRVEKDDQKRTATPREAFALGSDYIIVGRPIRDAQDPKAAAEEIQDTIRELF